MSYEEWILFHKIAAELLKEDPQRHLPTLATAYARRAKIPPEEAQMLIDAFSKALQEVVSKAQEEAAGAVGIAETVVFTGAAIKNLRIQKDKSKQAVKQELSCPDCNGELRNVTQPEDSDLNWDQWHQIRRGDKRCTGCKKFWFVDGDSLKPGHND